MIIYVWLLCGINMYNYFHFFQTLHKSHHIWSYSTFVINAAIALLQDMEKLFGTPVGMKLYFILFAHSQSNPKYLIFSFSQSSYLVETKPLSSTFVLNSDVFSHEKRERCPYVSFQRLVHKSCPILQNIWSIQRCKICFPQYEEIQSHLM